MSAATRHISAALSKGRPQSQSVLRTESIGSREKAVRNRMVQNVVGLLLLATVLSIVHVWSRVQVLDMRYALTKIQNRVTKISKKIHGIGSDVASLQSAERLQRIAKEKLHMAVPSAGQVVVVRSQQRVKAP
jgi:cell division protein FtsL